MSTLTLILDRIEADVGVFEGLGGVPLALLPAGVHEGAVIQVTHSPQQVVLTLDPRAAAGLEQRARSLQQQAAAVGPVAQGEGKTEPIAL